MSVGKAFAQKAGIVDNRAFAYAGHDVLQNTPAWRVIENVAGGNTGDTGGGGARGKFGEACPIARAAAQGECQVSAVGKGCSQGLQVGDERGVRRIRDQDGDQAFRVILQVLPGEIAGTLAGTGLAAAEQSAKTGIGGAVCRINENRGAAAQIQAAADDEADARFGGALVGARDAGQRIAVGDGERVVAEQGGCGEEFFRVGGAAEEGIIGGDLEFGEHIRKGKGLCPLTPLGPEAPDPHLWRVQ